MSEREEQSAELAGIIKREYVRAIDRKRVGDCYDAPADAILAAGYRKPRTITTAEELDGLGVGATVLDGLGDVWTNDGDTEDQWGSITAKEDFGGPQWYGSSNMHLPATVLYEPTA